MSESLQSKTFFGLIWKFTESFSIQAFGFIQGIILARLLMPSDYGEVALVGIFFALANCLVDSGFTNALIRKKDRTEIDYSTVYVTYVSMSIVMALLLCLCSGLIADFYHDPLIKQIVIVNAVLLFCQSFIATQGARMKINLEFKKLSLIKATATITTGIVSIIMAYLGFGVWSLVYPHFLHVVIRALLFWKVQHWFPGLQFSKKSFCEFFSYGSKLMLTGVVNILFGSINPIIIGRWYSKTTLGYYDKGAGYSSLPSNVLMGALIEVSFPILGKIQDDTERLASVYRRLISLSAFLVFPVTLLIFSLSRPFVMVVLTSKWEPIIPFMQVLCFAAMWAPVHSLNLNLLMVKGRSDLFFRIEMLKKVLALIVAFVCVPIGVLAMCYGGVFLAIVTLLINTYYTSKLIHVNLIQQLRDVLPSLAYALVMVLAVFLTLQLIPNLLAQLIIGGIVGVATYYGVSELTHSKDLAYLKQIVQENVLRRTRK